MARKGGKRGGSSSAARSAAAKKGWETRRRGGAKAKPAATKRTVASKPAAKRRGMPKTTSARGRALTNQRRAVDLVRASRGGKGPSAKAVRSVLTAQRARAFYAATGGGKKRSAVKAKSAAKIGKSIRAESRAKATAARAKVAGRARSRPVASPAQQRAEGLRARAAQLRQQGNALMGGSGRRDGAIVNAPLSSRARSGSINAGFRGLEMTRRADRLESRARGVEVRAQQSAAKAAREAAKPKRVRTPESLRISRAKQVEKRRSISVNPAGWRADASGRMAANAARTQQRALAFYRQKGKSIDVQIQRAKPGGQYGPDGHWYRGGAWMSQGKFVGGKPLTGNGANQRPAAHQGKGGSDPATRVIRNRAPAPRPITPRGQGLPAQPKLSKTAQKLNNEFFGSSGFLAGGLDKAIRGAGDGGRSPIDNTRYRAALASRLSDKELRTRTAKALKRLNREGRRSYIQNLQIARRDLPFSASATPRVGVSQGQLLNAIRFDLAAREIAGQRRARGKRNGRNSNEEYAWVTNAMLRASRRR